MTARIAILGIFVVDPTSQTLRLPRMRDFSAGRNECQSARKLVSEDFRFCLSLGGAQ